MVYSDELKETLKSLTCTKVWVSLQGEHSFNEHAGWREVSRAEILGIEETAAKEVVVQKRKKTFKK